MVCTCMRDHPEETILKVNTLAETLSVDLIMVILEDNLCPPAAQILVGQILACMAARIYLLQIGKEEAEKIKNVDILQLPATRRILEEIAAHARFNMEDSKIARA